METELRRQLREDILDRYDNKEYWEQDIIDNWENDSNNELDWNYLAELFGCHFVENEVMTIKEYDKILLNCRKKVNKNNCNLNKGEQNGK